MKNNKLYIAFAKASVGFFALCTVVFGLYALYLLFYPLVMAFVQRVGWVMFGLGVFGCGLLLFMFQAAAAYLNGELKE